MPNTQILVKQFLKEYQAAETICKGMENFKIDTFLIICNPEKILVVLALIYIGSREIVLFPYLGILHIVFFEIVPENSGPEPHPEIKEMGKHLILCLRQRLRINLLRKSSRDAVYIAHTFRSNDRKEQRRIIKFFPGGQFFLLW